MKIKKLSEHLHLTIIEVFVENLFYRLFWILTFALKLLENA